MEPRSLPIRLLEKMTNNFSEERLLGQGAYGKVYRGVSDDGQEVAVKMLHNNMQTIDDEQFIREFDNLMVLNHPNIVRLVGYCYETQRQHMDFQGINVFGETTYKALCFEYMPNGSLQKHLFDEFNGFDWQTRYKIIKGACEGLKYLHEGSRKTIYHLDLKPDNILLDENLVPKLADFGLSKLVGEEQTRVTHNPVGTIGYMPPEYLFGNIVSKKVDIFSLGVVMIKIISGPNGHTRHAEMQYQEFLDQVQEKWRKRLQATWSSPEPLEAQCQQVKRCTEIALSCMEMDRHKRPSIVDVIHELNKTEICTGKLTYEQDPSPPLASTSNVVQSAAPYPTPFDFESSAPLWYPPPKTTSMMSPSPPSSGGLMALLRRFIYRKPPDEPLYNKPPDGLLKITERVYVLDSCFTTDVFAGDNYQRQHYIKDIASRLESNFADTSFLVTNFGEGRRRGQSQSLLVKILNSHDMTVMGYPMQYVGCPVLTMELIHHFLRSADGWLSVGQKNVMIMHCEGGGWPVLAFILAGLLLYQKKFSSEKNTLEMIYKKAPRELIQLLTPINPMPSQIRYLQYISQRNIRSDSSWLPDDRPLTLDYVILRSIPDFNEEAGCTPMFHIYGQDPLFGTRNNPKVPFSTAKNYVRTYTQAEDYMIKIDVHRHIQGDVVLECTNMDVDKEREETMFRVMFNTSFIRSDTLVLDRDEIDILWDAKDRFPENFKAEVIFSEMAMEATKENLPA